MSIEVHNPHLVNSLVADAERRNFRAYPAAPTRKPNKTLYKTLPVPPPHQPTSADIICTDDIEKECYKQLLSNERIYRQLTNTENTLVKSLDEQLVESKEKHKSKYNVLFSKWEESIYNKLQGEIDVKLSGQQYTKLDTNKRRLFSRYLDTCNAKGTVFLDVISNEEYAPLSLANIASAVPAHKDPTKLSQTEDMISTSIQQDCGLNSTSRRGKNADKRGSCNEWIKLPLRDVDSGIRFRSRQRMIDKSCRSVPDEMDLTLPKRKHALPNYSLNRPLSQMFY